MKSSLKKRRNIIIMLLLGVPLFCLWQNNSIVTTKINYQNDKIPKEFIGYKIVQISDLHNKKFGNMQEKLLSKIEKAKPEIILITGDLIDKNRTDIEVAMDFIKGVIKIAPVYYVPGNHEALSPYSEELMQNLKAAGVYVLDNSSEQIEKDGVAIELIGVIDPNFMTYNNLEGSSTQQLNNKLKLLSEEKQSFKILLSHRPELIELYAENKIDLVFTGHAHGGQFRIPFVGGVVAPNQGLFPKYTSGSYNLDNTTMIVNRGLGNSIIPIRIFNRPEIIVVTLVE